MQASRLTIEQLREQLAISQGAPPPIADADPWLMPSAANFSAFEQHQLEEILKNFKLTPATMAFRLENKRLLDTDPLKWYPSPFLLNLSLRIATGIAKGGARIIISAPPRHGKSRISTIHSPTWVLENFASKHVVTTCYGADLAEDFARMVRDFITDNPDDLDVRIRQDANKISKFLTNKGGALTSIGVGGPITGRGADILLIDDYIKQIKEALSPTYRQYIWDWFTTTAMTRLEPGASVIIVATRWHHDDLIGRIIKNLGTTEDGGEWEYIKYHATARENDPLGRQVGEALFPQRYPVKVLEERRKLLGGIYYDAIFDQEPHDSDSDLTNKNWIIKKKAADIPQDHPFRLVRVWDFAGTETAKSDFTAGGLLCADDVNQQCGLLSMVRGQWTAAKVEAKVKEVAEMDGPNVDIVLCQETGSAGKAVVSHYANNLLKGYRVHGQYWNTGKVVVAQPWLAACETGDFWVLEAPWNQAFIDEFGTFPSEGAGFHDDQMDVCANGYIFLFGKKKLRTTWGRKALPAQAASKVDAYMAQKQAEKEAEMAEISPHRAMKQGKKFAFGMVRGATFGRRTPY